jgi:cardiolipin synthase
MTWTAALSWLFAGYALLTGVYIVLENRRPQATFAWMLLFLSLPGVGLLVYLLFAARASSLSRTCKRTRGLQAEGADGTARTREMSR